LPRKRTTRHRSPVKRPKEKKISQLSDRERELLSIHLDENIIESKRKIVHRTIVERSTNIGEGNFDRIDASDLKLLFDLYDREFFDNYFSVNHPRIVDFRVSTRMTRAGGKTTKERKGYTIALSSHLLERSFRNDHNEIKVNGKVCHDRLDAAMRIMEHEILHLHEFLLFGVSSCGKHRFKELGRNYFGHTATKHELRKREDIPEPDHDFRPGDIVLFDHGGNRIEGKITRITRRATVMVENKKGPYKGQDNKRYVKYYVPMRFLLLSNKGTDQ